jgi:hypothetical protein
MKQFLTSLIIITLFSCEKDTENTPDIIMGDLDPVAHYTFSGNTKDQSKYAHDGINYNASLRPDSLNQDSSSYYFGGISYIEIEDDDVLDIQTNKLTLTAWIKPAKTMGTYVIQKETLINSNGDLTEGGGPFSLDIFPGTPRALVYGVDKSFVMVTGTSTIQQNVWQHLALTWDGSTANLYYNGQLEATEPFAQPIMKTNGNVYIGAYKWTFPTASFRGQIDNVRIYNRALTKSEIGSLYNNYQ